MNTVVLPSGRVLDMDALKEEITFLHENVFSQQVDPRIIEWTSLDDRVEVLTFILNGIRPEPFHMTMVMQVNEGWERKAARIYQKSRLSELYEVPDDLSIITVRADVTPEVMRELRRYRLSQPDEYFGHYEFPDT